MFWPVSRATSPNHRVRLVAISEVGRQAERLMYMMARASQTSSDNFEALMHERDQIIELLARTKISNAPAPIRDKPLP